MFSVLLFIFQLDKTESTKLLKPEPEPVYNENCNVNNLLDMCIDTCSVDFSKCIEDCDHDTFCTSDCNRSLMRCYDDCPCMQNCFEGCDNCPNPICQFATVLVLTKDHNMNWRPPITITTHGQNNPIV